MQNVILNLRNEMIRSISAIDAWFDVDGSLLSQNINATETVAEFLYNLATTSRNLLDAITNKSPRNLGGPMDLQFPQDTLSDVSWKEGFDRLKLDNARAELREQLDRCLIYLELLLQRQSGVKRDLADGDVENFGGYQGIYLLLIHLKRYIGDLNQLAERHRSRTKQR
ncbi:MAG TPA: hypothetical protein VK658_10415 [Chryseolinea sp.]|nr:hypothetical protein [Chryseolinea sp.]